MADIFLDDLSYKRSSFIKYLLFGGTLGILAGIFIFMLNYQSMFVQNSPAMIIVLISLIVILVGFYLINKSRMDFI
jgi:hypothetical protein